MPAGGVNPQPQMTGAASGPRWVDEVRGAQPTAGKRAMQSISTLMSSKATPTVVRAGRGGSKYAS